MIIDPNSIDGARKLTADVCIVGSGAGGSVVARRLAEAGLRVVVLEDGDYNRSRDFTQREVDMLPRLYREQSSHATADFSVLVVQGRTVGGSTVPSFCVSLRPPPAILDAWEQRRGLAGCGSALMAPHFERVERELGVQPGREEDLNANNGRFRDGATKLELRGKLLANSRIDCVGCGFCALGCAYDRKNDALTVYLPAASRAGATIVPRCRVERIEQRDGKVAGVSAQVQVSAAESAELSVAAPVVVLAAGALGSAQLWMQSGLPDPFRQIGRHLHLHPQVVVQARFDEPIEGWSGVPQSWAVDQFVRLEPGGGGFWLQPTFAPPVTASALTPGFGAAHRGLMESYRKAAMAAVVLHDRTEGRVELDAQGRATVDYHLVEDDRADLMEGIQRAAEIFFAAGARKVALPFTDLVEVESVKDLAAVHRSVRSNDPVLVSFQPHGSLRMGREPRDSVVRASGESHGVRGLWVADASLFPTAVAVPPQLAVMAFASRVADAIRAGFA